MAPGTAWQAITLPPGRFLTSSWPWRSLVYLISGVMFGGAAAAVVVTAASIGLAVVAWALGHVGLTLTGIAALVGVAVAIVLTGVGTLAAGLAAALVIGRLERFRLRFVDSAPVPDPHRPPDRPGAVAWVRTRLREPATWRELGHTVVSACAMWWIDFGLVLLCVGGPISAIFSFFSTPNVPPGWIAVGVAAVIAAVPVTAYPISAWAAARAAMTRAALSDHDAELTRRLDETTSSRARLVQAFESEHRRIERDLHDGAQQRLVAMTVSLGLAKLDVEPGSDTHRHLTDAQEQARLALAELRELVRGIHPQVLTDRGLPAAVADVAGRTAVPVDLRFADVPRLSRAIESAAYFAVCEALVNVARHAHASAASVHGRVDGATLTIEVTDDGVGGADPARGTGLTGLADRVAVVDGRLHVSSPAGGPTVVRIEIPCGADAAPSPTQARPEPTPATHPEPVPRPHAQPRPEPAQPATAQSESTPSNGARPAPAPHRLETAQPETPQPETPQPQPAQPAWSSPRSAAERRESAAPRRAAPRGS